MLVRPYRRTDAEPIVRLYYDAVHAIADRDYSPAERAAWAPQPPDPESWHQRMMTRRTFVLEDAGEPIAFAELEADGNLDMFYCRPDRQRRGVGNRLYAALEAAARRAGMARLTVDASHPGRRFFERQGFQVERRQSVCRNGVTLVNFRMARRLD
jgi:putative acetyltransferase